MTEQEQRVWDAAFGAYCVRYRAPSLAAAIRAANCAVTMLRMVLAEAKTPKGPR